MQELDFPVRLHERGDDDFVIMVPHTEASWHNREAHKEKTNKTRSFCNWIRRTFPHVPTEFRYCSTKQVRFTTGGYWNRQRWKTVNCDKHFVAYGLTKSELMMVKLAWIYKTQIAVQKASGNKPEGAYEFSMPAGVRPTDALKKRLEKKTKAKQVKVS